MKKFKVTFKCSFGVYDPEDVVFTVLGDSKEEVTDKGWKLISGNDYIDEFEVEEIL